MKADQRREIADRFAVRAVDKFDELLKAKMLRFNCWPEELLEIQEDLADELYRELA